MTARRNDITRAFQDSADGRVPAASELLPLVYDQLRRAAQVQLASERAGHTLSATALVHEAYLKLAGPREIPWASRGHFYVAAAEAMRRILIDHARARSGRGESAQASRRLALAISGLSDGSVDVNPDGILALDDALVRLEGVDAQAAAVVRLRFYAGLDIERTALALGVSARTVKRDWAFARGWLRDDLERRGAL
jgi:RNA polymerase sigma factor (TIGR02999 family)